MALAAYRVDLVHVPMTELMRFMFEEAWREDPHSYLNPRGEPLMIAGHGTMGVEIFEELPTSTLCSSRSAEGALLCGVASVLKILKPSIRVFAVQARVNSALVARSKPEGRDGSTGKTPSSKVRPHR